MGCAVAGCTQAVWTSGLCSRHYNRLRKTGTTDNGPRARAPFADRFWRQVERRAADECWPWTGKSLLKGYGYIGVAGRGSGKLLSHRAVWTLTFGAIPQGQVVRHKCHNRLCCNPAHLELGSQADNVADMWDRPDGAPKGNARLSEADIEAIRKDDRPSRVVAPEYGVSHAHIRAVRQGRVWKRKTTPP